MSEKIEPSKTPIIEGCPTMGCDGVCKLHVGSGGLWGQIECQKCGYRGVLTEDPADAIYEHNQLCERNRLGKAAEKLQEKPPLDDGIDNYALVFNKGVQACLDMLPKGSGE